MGKQLQIGEQESDLLRFIGDRGAPVTVRDVAVDWGGPRGLARTTVLTMMERLRKKNFLTRKEGSGAALEYLPTQAKSDLMRSMVQDFIQNKLGGSVTPFVAYLTESNDLSDAELAELRQLVGMLDDAKAA